MRVLIQQLTPPRFFTVYIAQSILIIFYLVITFKLLRKKKDLSRKRILFSLYYLISSIGLIVNYFYPLIYHELITSLLYIITIYIAYGASNFIAVFSITLFYDIIGNLETTKTQTAYIAILGILYTALFFIPGGVMTNNETKWYPVVNLLFFTYCTSLVSLNFTIFIYYSIRTLEIFKLKNENRIIMNRWKIYIIGIIFTYSFAIITMLVHFLNDEHVRIIWAIVGGILFISGVYLTWFGIGKKFL